MSRGKKSEAHRQAVAGSTIACADVANRRRNWVWPLLLIIATILAYQQAWHAGYVWDDDKYVTENTLLTAKNGLKRIWFSLDSPSQYFPLVYTTFRFERALWGLNPAGYHWVNILLHTANALLLWQLLRLLRVPGAWLAAALFALHPVHVESVAWITERKNVLMGLFFLLSLLAWTKFLAEKAQSHWKFYVLALIFYVLALFSKTTACTLPAALLLIFWLKKEQIGWQRLLQIAPFVVFGVAMGLVSVWWERYHQGTQGPIFAIALPERILLANRALWFYAGKLLWPAHLAFSYPRWTISSANLLDYVWVFLTAGAAASIYFMRRYAGRGLEVAAIFFATTLSPMLGFIMLYTFRYSFVADHYQYLASIGPLALVAAGMAVVFDRVGRNARIVMLAGCGVLLLVLGLRTWAQGAIYADSDTLWKATMVENPTSWMAYGNLGTALHEKGKRDEAVAHYERALELNPDSFETHNNFGTALYDMERWDEAVAHYKKALEVYPGYSEAHYNLGRTLLRMGRPAEAVSHFGEALKINPYDAAAHNRIGDALVRMGRVDEGVGHFHSALQLNPKNADAHNNLGITLLELGRANEATTHFNKVLEIDPNSAEAHYNLGNALLRAGKAAEAISHYENALRINPNYAAAHNNLANTLAQMRRLSEAVPHYEKALEIDPNDAAAHNNLGRALTLMGREDEARAHLQRAQEIRSQSQR